MRQNLYSSTFATRDRRPERLPNYLVTDFTMSLALKPVPETISATDDSASTSTTRSDADRRGQAADHLAGRRVLDLLRHPLDR